LNAVQQASVPTIACFQCSFFFLNLFFYFFNLLFYFFFKKKPKKNKKFVLKKIKKNPKKRTASSEIKTSHKVKHAKKSLAVATSKNAENRKTKKLHFSIL
jgi:hypothetical protein